MPQLILQNIREMRNNMDEADANAFDAFIERNWGSGTKTKKTKKAEK